MSALFKIMKRKGILGSFSRLVGICADRVFTRVYASLLGVKIGAGTIIKPGAKIRRSGGVVEIGDDCLIEDGTRILAYGGTIRIGNGVSVNPLCILYGHGGLTIGNGVLIAAGTVVIPANHRRRRDIPIRGQGLDCLGIEIGEDVWIGTGVRILDGSTIERGAVLAAGGVVANTRVPANAIFGGVPARKIGERSA